MTSDNVREITKPKDMSDEASDASAFSKMDENNPELKIKQVNDKLDNVEIPNCDVTKVSKNAETEKIVCQTNNSDLENSTNDEIFSITENEINNEKSYKTENDKSSQSECEKSSKVENEKSSEKENGKTSKEEIEKSSNIENSNMQSIPICDEEVQFTTVDKYNGGNNETNCENLDETVPLGEKSKSFLEVEDELSQIPPPRRTGRKRKLSCLSPGNKTKYIMFRRLVRSGEVEPIKTYLESKENVPTMINLRDSEGGTALNEIATKTAQFVDIAKLLIDNGVDVNGSDELGKIANLTKTYPALPESPGGILKRKSRKLLLEKSIKLTEEEPSDKTNVENSSSNSNNGSGGGVKRRRSECDNDNLDDSQLEDRAAMSKRIRFNPVDSYGQAIEDTAKFSSEEDD